MGGGEEALFIQSSIHSVLFIKGLLSPGHYSRLWGQRNEQDTIMWGREGRQMSVSHGINNHFIAIVENVVPLAPSL